MPWVVRSCKSLEKMPEAPAVEDHNHCIIHKMQLELMWQVAEKAKDAKKALEKASEDIKGSAQIRMARTVWYNSWVALVSLLDCEEGSP